MSVSYEREQAAHKLLNIHVAKEQAAIWKRRKAYMEKVAACDTAISNILKNTQVECLKLQVWSRLRCQALHW